MEWGTVSTASILGMVFTLIISVGIPFILMAIIRRKTRARISSFFIGCGIFLVFALILEQILHVVVQMTVGAMLQENIFLYGLYGGLAAALFEETGRYIAMRFFMKERLDKGNALMYGAGHGGIEAILIVGITSVNNIATSIMINSGGIQATMAMLDSELAETTYQQLEALWQLPAYQFYMGGVERMCAIALQICLSVLVYKAVKTGERKYFAGAFLLHFAVDFLTVVTASALSVWAVEVVLVITVAVIGGCTMTLYRKE